MRVLAFVLLISTSSISQAHSSPFVWLGSWLLPDGFREGYQLREFIASPRYDTLRKMATDRETLDALYEYAYYKTHGDERSAAFAMLVAVFEHRTIPLKIGLSVPLTFESEEAFTYRTERLPRYIYNDTTDDRDKLQHFFSSAYGEHALSMTWFVNFIGEIVEILEGELVSGGANDRRDIVANHDGIRFAKKRETLPSKCLTK